MPEALKFFAFEGAGLCAAAKGKMRDTAVFERAEQSDFIAKLGFTIVAQIVFAGKKAVGGDLGEAIHRAVLRRRRILIEGIEPVCACQILSA